MFFSLCYNSHMSTISVKHLSKTFRSPQKEPGFTGAIKSLFNRKYIEKKAVHDISFEIERGELIGFIGPNGAGKTTTLKCLSGLLYPSEGEVRVLGFEPFQRQKEFLQQIALVMGQKNQLWWDLPAQESFLLNKEIYQISDKQFKNTLDELIELLQVRDILHIPVRNLSLGQRMKCELIAALIHQPKVLFLDEPTIGLDVVMQQNLREFIRAYNKQFQSTIILTSHYMEDVKELCERVIVIDHGQVLFDGKLAEIIRKYATHKLLKVTFTKEVSIEAVQSFGDIQLFEKNSVVLSVPVERSNQIAAKLLEGFPIDDFVIEETKIEDIIRQVFEAGK